MKNVFAILLLTVVLAGCSSNRAVVEEKRPYYKEDKAWAERVVDSNGNIFLTSHSVHYQFHELMLTDLPTPVMMEIQEDRSVQMSTQKPVVTTEHVTTWRITDTALVQLSQLSVPTPGGSLDNRNTNWYTVVYAKPGKESVTTIYNLVNGEKVMNYSGSLAKLTLPKTAVTRYIGFHAINSALPIEGEGSAPDLAGILTYAKPNGSLAKAILKIRDSRLMDAIRQYPPQIFLVTERMGNNIRTQTMELWPPQGEDFLTVPDDFYIEINYGKIREIEPIRIHVLQDKLVMEPQPDQRVSLELIP